MRTDPKFSRRLAAIPSLYGIPLNEVARKARMEPQSVRRIAEGRGAYWLERSMIKLVPIVDNIYATAKIIGPMPADQRLDVEAIHARADAECGSQFVGFLLGIILTIACSWWLGFYEATVTREVYYPSACASAGSSSGSSSSDAAIDGSFDLGDCGAITVGGSCGDEY